MRRKKERDIDKELEKKRRIREMDIKNKKERRKGGGKPK